MPGFVPNSPPPSPPCPNRTSSSPKLNSSPSRPLSPSRSLSSPHMSSLRISPPRSRPTPVNFSPCSSSSPPTSLPPSSLSPSSFSLSKKSPLSPCRTPPLLYSPSPPSSPLFSLSTPPSSPHAHTFSISPHRQLSPPQQPSSPPSSPSLSPPSSPFVPSSSRPNLSPTRSFYIRPISPRKLSPTRSFSSRPLLPSPPGSPPTSPTPFPPKTPFSLRPISPHRKLSGSPSPPSSPPFNPSSPHPILTPTRSNASRTLSPSFSPPTRRKKTFTPRRQLIPSSPPPSPPTPLQPPPLDPLPSHLPPPSSSPPSPSHPSPPPSPPSSPSLFPSFCPSWNVEEFPVVSVCENMCISHSSRGGKLCRMAFDLKDVDMSYSIGETCSILVPNDPNIILSLLKECPNIPREMEFSFSPQSTYEDIPSSSSPRKTITLLELFLFHLDLFAPPPRSLLPSLLPYSSPTPSSTTIKFAENSSTVAEILYHLRNQNIVWRHALFLIPKLTAREFQICSSQLRFPDKLYVIYRTFHHNPCMFYSNDGLYLKNMRVGKGIPMKIKQHKQKLIADPSSPLILVCVGTGVGVGIAILQEHKLYKEQRKKLGPLFLLLCPLLTPLPSPSPPPPVSPFSQLVNEIEEKWGEGGEEEERGYRREEVIEGKEGERGEKGGGEEGGGERRVVWYGGKLERLPQYLRKEGKFLWPLLGAKKSVFSYEGPKGDLLGAIEKAIEISSPFGTVVASQMIGEMKMLQRWKRGGGVVDILPSEMDNNNNYFFSPTGTLRGAPFREAFRWLITNPATFSSSSTPSPSSLCSSPSSSPVLSANSSSFGEGVGGMGGWGAEKKDLAGLLVCLNRFEKGTGEHIIIKELWRVSKMAAISPQETKEIIYNFLNFWFKVIDVAYGVSFHLSGLHKVRREIINLVEKTLPANLNHIIKMKIIHRSSSSPSSPSSSPSSPSSPWRRRKSEFGLGAGKVEGGGEQEGGYKKKRKGFLYQRPPSPPSPVSLSFSSSFYTSDPVAFSPSNSPPPFPPSISPKISSPNLSSSNPSPPLSSSPLSSHSNFPPSSSNSSPNLFSPSRKKTLFNRDTSTSFEASHIYHFSEREVASELFEMSVTLYSKMTVTELLKCAWMKKENNAENVHSMSHYYNKITSWVAREVLMSAGEKIRVKTYSFFVRVANVLQEKGDILSLAGIYGGLTHFTVMRITSLKKYFVGNGGGGGGTGGGKKGERKKEVEIVEKIGDLLCPTMNNSNYRSFWREKCGLGGGGGGEKGGGGEEKGGGEKGIEKGGGGEKGVPYLAIHLRDLVFLEDGNPDYLNEKMINLEKMARLWEVTRTLMGGRVGGGGDGGSPSFAGVGFTSCVKVKSYLLKKWEECPPNDDVLYGISHKLQPFRGEAQEEKGGKFVAKVLTQKLFLYCEKGDIKAALSMINEKLATPDLQDETTGDTAIHVCIASGKSKMMKALLHSLSPPPTSPTSPPLPKKKPPSPSPSPSPAPTPHLLTIQNHQGNTPLHLACVHNDWDSVKFLLQRCPLKGLFIKNDEGLYPLSSASPPLRGLARTEVIFPRLLGLEGEGEGGEEEWGEGEVKEKKRAKGRGRRKSGDEMENWLMGGMGIIMRLAVFLQQLGKIIAKKGKETNSNNKEAQLSQMEEALLLLLLSLLHHFQTEEEYFLRIQFHEAPSHILSQGELFQKVEKYCLVVTQTREKGRPLPPGGSLVKLAEGVIGRMEEEGVLFGFK